MQETKTWLVSDLGGSIPRSYQGRGFNQFGKHNLPDPQNQVILLTHEPNMITGIGIDHRTTPTTPTHRIIMAVGHFTPKRDSYFHSSINRVQVSWLCSLKFIAKQMALWGKNTFPSMVGQKPWGTVFTGSRQWTSLRHDSGDKQCKDIMATKDQRRRLKSLMSDRRSWSVNQFSCENHEMHGQVPCQRFIKHMSHVH